MERRPALVSRPPSRARTLISAVVAFLLMATMLPFSHPPTAVAASDDARQVSVLLHFKDSAGETVDFTSYSAPCVREGDALFVAVGDGTAARTYADRLSFAVYDNYAAFNHRQTDITDECSYDAAAGLVRLPARCEGNLDSLAIVFWLSPAHAAYDRFIAANLIVDDVAIEHDGNSAVLRSDVSDLKVAAERASTMPAADAPLFRSVAFPGQSDKHYRLNPYTRLEEFDRDQTEKQIAYGYTGHWVGSYCFGALFGTHRTFSNGTSSETDWNAPVLDTGHSSYDETVEAYLYDTIAARLGEDAAFATSMAGKSYRDRCITLGTTYKDDGYVEGKSPDHKAISRGACGSSDINNGAGTPLPQPNGDNYITYKGIYNGSQTQYAGWYMFFYKFDTMSGKTGNTFQDVVGYLLTKPGRGGNAQLTKVSTNPVISKANGNYSLEHGVFAAFADEQAARDGLRRAQAHEWRTWQEAQTWASANASAVFVTEKSGVSPVVGDIEAGDYFVAELFAPPGFRLADHLEQITVEVAQSDDDIGAFTFEDVPQSGSLDLLKVSNNPELTTGNECYSLSRASYGIFTDAACLNLFRTISTSPDQDGNGYARTDEMPIGTYWVKETSRPEFGYALDSLTYPVTVTDRTVTRVHTTSVSDKAKMNSLGLLLQKKDAQTHEAAPQGAATLGDAHFRINYYDVPQGTAESIGNREPRASWLVRTDDTGSFLLENADSFFTHTDTDGATTSLPYKISGPDFFKLSNGQVALPLGTYTVQEVKAPAGYLLDETVHIRHISDADSDEEVVETFEAEQDGDLVTDRVARADVSFLKRADGAAKLVGIPFKLTSKTTGEWHILVTDKNGMASTQATTAHPHSSLTNGNDEQFRAEDGSFRLPLVLDATALNAAAGTWFGLDSAGGAVPVDDRLGALPYDTYELEELPCPANEPFQMIQDEIVVDVADEGVVIDLGTLNDSVEGKPSLRTTAYDGASNDPADSEISANDAAAVIDRVDYTGLTPGESYTLEGILMDKATGEPFLAEGETVVGTTAFTAADSAGYAEVSFAFDASHLVERTELVVFETLTHEGREIASHRDLQDRKQTVIVNPVALSTTALDRETGTHLGVPAEEVAIVDTVTYQGLVPGHEYRLVALLMDKDTGEPFTIDDRVISAEKAFTPEEAAGTVDVPIVIPGTNLDGASLVVFESLYYEDRELAVHADLADEGQTVSYGYPDFPLPPTGGEEDADKPLAQTGDPVGLAFALLAVGGAIAAAVAIVTRRRPRP